MAYPEFEKPVTSETLRAITSLKVSLQLAMDAALVARVVHSGVRRKAELDDCARQITKARTTLDQIMRELAPNDPPAKASLHVIDGGAA